MEPIEFLLWECRLAHIDFFRRHCENDENDDDNKDIASIHPD